jgi:hypothetical protein
MASLAKKLWFSRRVIPDETGLSTDLIRRYGRALGGARIRDAAPAGHWQTMTLIAGLRADLEVE